MKKLIKKQGVGSQVPEGAFVTSKFENYYLLYQQLMTKNSLVELHSNANHVPSNVMYYTSILRKPLFPIVVMPIFSLPTCI